MERIIQVVSATQVCPDIVVSYANNSPATTVVEVPIIKINEVSTACYKIAVYNPSTVSDLTCDVYDTATLGGAPHDFYLGTIAIPKKQTIRGKVREASSTKIEGIYVGCDLKLVFTNDSALGASDAFTAYVRIREV